MMSIRKRWMYNGGNYDVLRKWLQKGGHCDVQVKRVEGQGRAYDWRGEFGLLNDTWFQ